MAQLPIVLAHGYLGFGTLGPLNYFNNVASVLKQSGAQEVYATDVDPKGSLDDRSSQLAAQIRHFVPTGKVHLIAHSMGGLDARYLIGKPHGEDLIASLTALGSPFQGTFAADVAADRSKLLQVGAPKLLAALQQLQVGAVTHLPETLPQQIRFTVGAFRSALSGLTTSDYSNAGTYFKGLFSLSDAAVKELTTEQCLQRFPADEHDLKGVPSSSYAGLVDSSAASPFLSASAVVLSAMGQPNDGIVPVRSATLKDHRGTLNNVDHLGLVGWGPTDVSGCYKEIYQRLPNTA
jgi:triacylglycerol lipase